MRRYQPKKEEANGDSDEVDSEEISRRTSPEPHKGVGNLARGKILNMTTDAIMVCNDKECVVEYGNKLVHRQLVSIEGRSKSWVAYRCSKHEPVIPSSFTSHK